MHRGEGEESLILIRKANTRDSLFVETGSDDNCIDSLATNKGDGGKDRSEKLPSESPPARARLVNAPVSILVTRLSLRNECKGTCL